MKTFKLSKKESKKWLSNILYFTAPAVAILFSLLANGVEFNKAYPVALLALYGVIADYFKKLKK